MTRVSVVVTNHDYADYVGTALDSALAQTWEDVEVVVVDDGSTDGSRQVLRAYRDRVRAVLQPHRGQAAAFQAGFAASSGDVVLFLDADDLLLPTAAASAAAAFRASPTAVKVTWPMWEVDRRGRRSGVLHPPVPLPRGELRSLVLEQGADCYVSAPSSGNAWSRDFLAQVLPAPEGDFVRGADGYLITLAPLFGSVEALDEPQSCYRLHDRNGFWRPSLEERVAGALQRHEVRARALDAVVARLGLERSGHPTGNPYTAWLRRVARVVDRVRAFVPPGQDFLLLDGGEWGERLLADRAHVPFTERDGCYWGPPADDDAAAAELVRQLAQGVRHVVVGWQAAWWLDAYPSLGRLLRTVSEDEDVHLLVPAAAP